MTTDSLFDQVCKQLGLDPFYLTPAEANVILGACDAYMASLRNYTNRYLTKAKWLDTFDATRSIILGEYPVISIESIFVNDTLIQPTMYRVDKRNGLLYAAYRDSYNSALISGISYWYGPVWGSCGYTETRITYVAGYDPFPADLILLVSDYAMDRLKIYRVNQASAGGLSGVLIGAVKSVQVDGVGMVTMAEQSGSSNQGFTRTSAAQGGPILGAGITVAALYRDTEKIIVPMDHRILSESLLLEAPVP
jgi:hypothetical protein